MRFVDRLAVRALARFLRIVPIVVVLAAGCAHGQVPPPVEVAYGPHALQRLDLYPQPVAVTRCVLLVHGGGWRAGDKRQWTAPLKHHRDLLHAAGWLVASTNYRLAPAHRYPDPVDDVEAAIAYLRASGCSHLVMVAESAGAAVGALAGARAGIEAYVGLAGVYDFAALPPGGVYDLAADYLGCDPATCPAAVEASPITSWEPVPALFVHGDADTAVPLAQSEAMAGAKLAELWLVPGGLHTGPTLLSAPLDVAVLRTLAPAAYGRTW